MCDEDKMPHYSAMVDEAVDIAKGEPGALFYSGAREPDVDVIYKGKLVGRVFHADPYGNKPSLIEHPKLGRLRVIAMTEPKRVRFNFDLIERGIATVEKDGDDGMMHELWRLH